MHRGYAWLYINLALTIKFAVSIRLKDAFNPLEALTQAVIPAAAPRLGSMLNLLPQRNVQEGPYEGLPQEQESNVPGGQSADTHLNLSPQEIQLMESAAAAAKQQNMKLGKDITSLEKNTNQLEEHMNELQSRKELDRKRYANLRAFEQSVSPESILKSIHSLGATGKSTGVFEAPIIVLQPEPLSITERLMSKWTSQCGNELCREHAKIENILKEYTHLETEEEIDNEIENLDTELNSEGEEHKHYENESEELMDLLKQGDTTARDKLSKISEQINVSNRKMDETREKIMALRVKKRNIAENGPANKTGNQGRSGTSNATQQRRRF